MGPRTSMMTPLPLMLKRITSERAMSRLSLEPTPSFRLTRLVTHLENPTVLLFHLRLLPPQLLPNKRHSRPPRLLMLPLETLPTLMLLILLNITLPLLEIFKPKEETETITSTQPDLNGLEDKDGKLLTFKLTLRTHSVNLTKLSCHPRLPPQLLSQLNKLLKPPTLPVLSLNTPPMEPLLNLTRTTFLLPEISKPPMLLLEMIR